MKKILSLVSLLFIFSCNQGNDSTTLASKNSLQHTEHAADQASLTLNDGNKWKADTITNRNVLELKTLADNFRIKPIRTVQDYQLVGNDLKAGIDTMINQCKMKGDDHEALHHWLEPVLKNVNDLKSLTDTSVGRKLFSSIDDQLDNYKNYFE